MYYIRNSPSYRRPAGEIIISETPRLSRVEARAPSPCTPSVLCFIACYAIISSRHTTAGLLAAVDGHTLFRRAPKSIVAAALSLVPTLCSRRPLPRPVVVHSPEVRPVRRRHRGHRARRLSRQQRGHVVRPQFGRWMARTLEIRHYISIRFLPRDGNPSLIWRTARFACKTTRVVYSTVDDIT